jgi:hypothetical protein
VLKPHDFRHGVAMEVYEQHGDLEQVRGLLGHTRIETTQLYAKNRPAALKQAVEFYANPCMSHNRVFANMLRELWAQPRTIRTRG